MLRRVFTDTKGSRWRIGDCRTMMKPCLEGYISLARGFYDETLEPVTRTTGRRIVQARPLATLTFASWNRLAKWFRQLEALRERTTMLFV